MAIIMQSGFEQGDPIEDRGLADVRAEIEQATAAALLLAYIRVMKRHNEAYVGSISPSVSREELKAIFKMAYGGTNLNRHEAMMAIEEALDEFWSLDV